MNLLDAKKKLAKNGIYQLNKGESLKDALDFVDNKIPRKGYKYKRDDGSLMSKNEIISNENKEAFHRSFTPATFSKDEVECIDDIPAADDFREDKSRRGNIINCFYCGSCIRVDGYDLVEHDYDTPEDTIHCESCMNDAISRLVM